MAEEGEVVSISGPSLEVAKVYVIKSNGEKISLNQGDTVNAGDTIVTPEGVVVEVRAGNGQIVTIQAEQVVKFTVEMVATGFAEELKESTIDEATIQTVIQAVREGQDIGDVLEDTAAGILGGSRLEGGFEFVDIPRILEPNVLSLPFSIAANSLTDQIFDPLFSLPVDEAILTTDSEGDSNTDVTTLSISADGSVAEGGNITYTATLTNAAETAMVVNLSNGGVINIAAGTSSGTVSVAAPGDDVYVDAGSVSATIASSTGGNFESLVEDPSAATTTVTDTIDSSTVTLSSSTAGANIIEGGSIVYTATVDNAPLTTPLVVSLSNGQTITIAVGALSADSAAFAVRADDNYIDADDNLSVTISGTSGGEYELLNEAGTVTNTVVDDSDVTTLSISADGSVAEGGNITYTATLTNAAETAMVVNLSNGGVINIAAGTSSGTVSVAAPGDDVYVDAGSVSATIASSTGGNFESLVEDPSAATTTVTDTIDSSTVSITGSASVIEGDLATYTLSLTNPAQTDDVIVNLTYGGTAVNGSDYVGVATATILAGSDTASFNIPTVGDLDTEVLESLTVTITSATGGTLENIVVSGSAGSVMTDIVDNDTPPVAVDDNITAVEDTVFNSVLELDANDTDVDGDALSVVAGTFSTMQGGVIVIAANGSYSYTAPEHYSGTDSVDYTVTDGNLTDVGTLNILVTAVADAPIINSQNQINVINPTLATTTLVGNGTTDGLSLIHI